MRKLKLFFACLLMAVLSIGQVWADSFTITFKGTGTSNDGSSALSSTTVADYVSDGASYVSAISASGKVFIGQQAWGLKFGNSSYPGTVTLTLKDALKPDSIVINASPWSATEGKGVLQDSVFNTTKTGAKGTFANFKYVYDGNTEVTTITLGTNSNGKRGYVKSVTVFYTSEAPSYTISAQSNDNSKGTVSLSGSVITGSPKAGFRYASPAYSVSPANSATVSQNGNAFTVTPSANTTVTINFEAIPTYTVQFSTGNGNPAVESKTETVGGAGITLPEGPTPTCSADGWVFAGWKETSAVASETTTAPTLLAANTNYKPTSNCTLYAVYKKIVASGSPVLKYTQISSTSIADKDTVVITYIVGDAYYAIPNNGGTSAPTVNLVSVSEGELASLPAATLKWDVAKDGSGNLTFYPKGTTASWLYCIDNNNGLKQGTGDDKTFILDNTYHKDNNPDSKYYLKNVGQARWIGVYKNSGTPQDFRSYTSINSNIGNQELAFFKATEESASTTYYLSTPSCCTKHDISIASGIEDGSISADLAEACEGTTVTITFTPDGGYHLKSWSVNGTAQDIAASTFSMPATDVTVSAVFEHDDCSNLAAPTLNGAVVATQTSATINWNAVADASSYLLSVTKHEGGTSVFSGNVGNVLTKELTSLEKNTQYDYSIMAVGDGVVKCAEGNGVLANNFTTPDYPAATLTLSENEIERTFPGSHKQYDVIQLPTTAVTACNGKVLVGWDANENCATTPTYAKGADFTLTATSQKLYAVYANETPGTATLTKMDENYTPTAGDNLVIVGVDSDDDSEHALYQEASGSYVKNWTFDNKVATVAADAKKYVTLETATDGKFYLGDATNGYVYSSGSNNLSIDASNKTAWTIAWDDDASAFTFNQGRYLSCRKDLTDTYKYLYRLAGSTPAGIYKLDVYKYAVSASTYSNYATTCVAPLASPTFSVDPADGPFNTAQTIELTATEGDIYYNINSADDPTSASTPYTGAITIDACGSTTIKAIAISSTNQSLVASATYVLNIPVPTNSQVAPYSPTEARDVIASGCYDGSTIMYVKGVVKSTTEYSSTYGNYDIVVRNIGNVDSETFTYYHMYKASGKTKFTTDENIEVGDTILAAGVLTLYGSTYEFANNTCYMVEHKKIASKTSIANDEANAYTVEEAKAFCNAPTVYDLSDEVYVKGVAYGAPNNQGTFNIHDANSDNTFQIYKGTLSAALEALSVEIEENDTIVAKGTIQYYNSTSYQMNAGGEVVTVKKYVAPTIHVTGVELDETAISLKEGLSTTLVATVNPTEASNKNVTWESSNPAVATVDNGEITAVAIGTTTITVTTVDGGYTATCTVTVNDASARDLPNAAFQKVTSTSQITDGKYLIVYAAAGVDTVAFDGALTTLDAVGNTIDVTIDGDYIVAPGDAAFTIDVTAGTLKSYSGKYIGRTANSNGMNQADNATLTNTFAINGDGNAVITSSGNPTLRYNKASDQIRFRYYKTGQQDIQLYKMVEPEEIRDNLNDGKWGTICPAKKVLAPVGASFYKLNYMELNPDGSPYKFFFDEIGENAYLEAGKPYLFIAEGTTITGVKVGDAEDNGLHVHNGFVGYLGSGNYDLSSDYDVYTAGANNYYGLQNNIFKLIYGTNSYMVNERAFVQITPTSKPATTEQPAPAYSRRRLVVGAGAPQVTTGTENIEASETPVKVMIDGNLFILRGEKMYDATGRLVK